MHSQERKGTTVFKGKVVLQICQHRQRDERVETTTAPRDAGHAVLEFVKFQVIAGLKFPPLETVVTA